MKRPRARPRCRPCARCDACCSSSRTKQGSLLSYLDKFHYPLWITQFYENIDSRDATTSSSEAYGHGVRLLELRYAPAIHTFGGLTLRQAIRAVLSGMNRAVRAPPRPASSG